MTAGMSVKALQSRSIILLPLTGKGRLLWFSVQGRGTPRLHSYTSNRFARFDHTDAQPADMQAYALCAAANVAHLFAHMIEDQRFAAHS